MVLRALVALLTCLFLSLQAEADTFKKGFAGNGDCLKKKKFPFTCNGAVLSNSLSTDFNSTSFTGRAEGPTDTAIHTSAPIGDFSGCLWFEVDTAIARFQGPAGSATSFSYADGYCVYRGTSDNIVEFYVGSFSSSFSADYSPTDVWGTANGWQHLCYAHQASNRQYTVWHNAVQMQSGINASPASRPWSPDT